MEDSASKRTRASGEVLDFLLREFEINQNPSADQRKEISERTNMPEKAVRIWFQNRRAKLRKFERMGKPVNPLKPGQSYSPKNLDSGNSSRSNSLTNASAVQNEKLSATQSELNDKYCFVDCSSLSVGSWQRIKSGQHDRQVLKSLLVNLSPFTLDQVMVNFDLMVILSRKNNEINYFFSAVSNNSKIFFRIFYPLSYIISCSLLDNSITKESNELRINLSHKPMFSVFFFNGDNANLNQWSICDDFSEGQQVTSAVYAPGGISTPHVLVGVKGSLAFLHGFIQRHNQNSDEKSLDSMDQMERPSPDNHISMHVEIGMDPAPHETFAPNPQNISDGTGKQEEVWESSPRVDGDYDMDKVASGAELGPPSPNSAIGHNSHTQSESVLKNGAGQLGLGDSSRKADTDYGDIFTNTPDFFSAVQSPNSHLLFSHSHSQEHESLLSNTSSTAHALHEQELPNGGVSSVPFNRESSEYPDSHYTPSDSIYRGEPNSNHNYDLDAQIEDAGFQPNDLLVESPALATNAPTPSGTGLRDDHFIDYDGDT